jgi:tripartite ATP-independent transporter DctM subunit
MAVVSHVVQAAPGMVRPAAGGVSRVIGLVVEPVSAALLLIEVVLLAAGVFARYVLQAPLDWSDELAGLLFVWLTMLGAVSAYRRDAHMRLTVMLRRAGPRVAGFLEAVGTVCVALFCLGLLAALLLPSFMPDFAGPVGFLRILADGSFFADSYFAQQQIDVTPGLGLPRTIAAAAIVVGLLLILVLAVAQLVRQRARAVLSALGVVAGLGLVAVLLRPVFLHLGEWDLLLFFVVFVAVQIAIGVPIAFAFGLATLIYLGLATSLPLSVVAGQMDDGMSNLVLLAIPLFVLLGFLIESVGIARRLVEAIVALVGHVRGGLNIVLVAAMFLVSGISGSKLADMAAVTPVLFPEMERRGHRRGEMVALLASSGAMAELIPPSLVLIVLGTVCNLSIQSLFIGGLLPAAVASVFLIGASLLRSRKRREAVVKRATLRQLGKALVVALPGLILPVLIRYFVVAGITTATEVSTVGVVYSVLVGVLVYREFRWREIYPMLVETAGLTGSILLIIATATAMAWALTQSGFATTLAGLLANAPGGKWGFLALSIVLFMGLGSVLEGIPAIVLFGPLLFPLAKQLGLNEIHYAVVTVLALSLGLFAPPLGVGYYGACTVGRADPEEAALAIVPYLLALFAALVLIAAVPWLSTGFL